MQTASIGMFWEKKHDLKYFVETLSSDNHHYIGIKMLNAAIAEV